MDLAPPPQGVTASRAPRGCPAWGAKPGNVWAYLDLGSAAAALRSVAAATANGAGDAMGALVAARAIAITTGGRDALDRAADMVRLVVGGALIAAGTSALAGTAGLVLAGFLEQSRYGVALATWWVGDAMGTVLLTPLLLAWSKGAQGCRFGRAELAALAAAALISATNENLALPLPALPLLTWAVFRFDRRVSFSMVAGVAALTVVLYAVVHPLGPPATAAYVNLQLVLAVVTVPMYVLRGALDEREQANRALQENERRFALVANAAPVLIWSGGIDGRRNWFNRRWLEFTGNSQEQEAGDGWARGIHPDDDARYQATVAEAKAARQCYRLEYPLRRHDGEYRWLLETGAPRLDGGDSVVGYIGSCVEITDHRRLEEQLRLSEERWKLALEGAGDAVWDWDYPSGQVFYSRRGRQMLGYAEDEVPSRVEEWRARIHPADRERTLARLQCHLDGRTAVFTDEHRLRCKDGTWKRILARGIVLTRDAAGRPLRVIGTHTDVTDHRREQEDLAHRERQVRKYESLCCMAGAVAHHFNTQFMAVLGNLHLARQALPGDGVAGGCIDNATTAARRAAEISSVMRTYLGQARTQYAPLELARWARDSMEVLRAAVPAAVSVETDLPDAGPVVKADAGQLHLSLTPRLWASSPDFTPARHTHPSCSPKRSSRTAGA